MAGWIREGWGNGEEDRRHGEIRLCLAMPGLKWGRLRMRLEGQLSTGEEEAR